VSLYEGSPAPHSLEEPTFADTSCPESTAARLQQQEPLDAATLLGINSSPQSEEQQGISRDSSQLPALDRLQTQEVSGEGRLHFAGGQRVKEE
jgi:hypothetical protein